MSYWYWRALKTDWVLNEGETNKFDLPERGLLSGLIIQSECRNAQTLHPIDDIYPVQKHTKIRLVGNGNFEIVNCRGRQLQAINCWNMNISPRGNYSNIKQTTWRQRNDFYMLFGRHLGDPKYGLDLSKFAAGVEFEETNDYSTTYYENDYQKLTIMGLFRKTPEPGLFASGFLKKRQIIDKTSTGATQYGVKLPTLAKLRNIHLFSEPTITSKEEAYAAWLNVNKIRLSVKSKEEYIINDVDTEDFASLIHDVYGRRFRTHMIHADGGGETGEGFLDTMLYRRYDYGATPEQVSSADWDVILDFERGRTQKYFTVHAGSASAGLTSNFYNEGIMLHGLVPLLFQDPKSDEEEWLDTEAMKDVYVEVTEGGAYGKWYLVLDELEKTYPT